MFRDIGTPELIIIALVIIVLFGGKKLIEFARGLGESTKELKKVGRELRGAKEELKKKD